MSSGKKAHRAKGTSRHRVVEAAPVAEALPEIEVDRTLEPRLYDMPFSSVAPRLIRPEVGLHNLVARAGEHAAYEIDVTLLDAPDHRLIRTGVLLAHRVLDGRGEWFLTAPDWQPLLPKDRIELMGHSDLPDELAALISPLRRRATLGPVAALRCERREFALRDDAGTTLALLRDDKVTVRRGGLTTARYREVRVTPVGPGLGEDQRAFLDRAFAGSGANRVPRFPRLVTRLGAPATGRSDIPDPQPVDASTSFRRFVAGVLAYRLREMVRHDLAVRGGRVAEGARVATEAAELRGELVGLSDVLDPEWVEDLLDDLAWVVAPAADPGALAPDGALSVRLRSERYLSVLERLVGAARSPRLRAEVAGGEPVAAVLQALLDDALAALHARVGAVRLDADATADAEAWTAVRSRFAVLQHLVELAGPVLPEPADRIGRRLAKPARLLRQVRPYDQVLPALDGLEADQAFAAGQAYERDSEASRRARHDFVERWAKTARKLEA